MHLTLPTIVSQLWNDRKDWDLNKLNQIFDQEMTQIITQVQIVPQDNEDRLCWTPTTSGICTSKSAYKQVSSNSDSNSSNFNSLHRNILLKTWSTKCIPPKVKTFIWRLIRHALQILATNLHSKVSNILDSCSRCSSPETDTHLFFHCTFARLTFTR